MRKSLTFYLFFFLLFLPVIVFSTNSYAENNNRLHFLLKELGVSHISYLNQEPISDIPQNKVIRCWVIDPEKLDVFEKFEEVELTKIEVDKWELKNPDTGIEIEFSTQYEDGRLMVIKVESSPSATPVLASPPILPLSSDQIDLKGRFTFGARASYVSFTKGDYEVSGIKVDTDPDDSVMVEVLANYFFSNYFSVELSAGYLNTDIDLSGAGVSGKGGTLIQKPILLTGRMSMPIKSNIVPYLGIGAGIFFNTFNQKDEVVDSIYGTKADLDFEHNFGFHANGGFDFLVTDKVALNLDFKYIWSKIEADVEINGKNKNEEFDANMLVVGAGIKYYF